MRHNYPTDRQTIIDWSLGYKYCPDCLQMKDLTEYHNHQGKPGDIETYCRPCQLARARLKPSYISKLKGGRGRPRLYNVIEKLA